MSLIFKIQVMEKKYKLNVVCFGEILWDIFPTHKKIGGAPLNVALRMNSLGVFSTIVSKIGNDENGKEIIKYIEDHNMSADTIQVDSDYVTGAVHVMINEKGNASYDIHYPSAWDKISGNNDIEQQISEADAFVFGSLACRDEVTRATLYTLLDKAKYKILDANLRPPYYTMDILIELMNRADFIKLNDEELVEISKKMNSPFNSFEQNIKFIAEQTKTKQICVTKGAFGAILFCNGKFYYNSGYFVNVVDTVGAGDSFLAALIVQLLRGKLPQKALNYACAIGALVAASEGANPKITEKEIKKFMMV